MCINKKYIAEKKLIAACVIFLFDVNTTCSLLFMRSAFLHSNKIKRNNFIMYCDYL